MKLTTTQKETATLIRIAAAQHWGCPLVEIDYLSCLWMAAKGEKLPWATKKTETFAFNYQPSGGKTWAAEIVGLDAKWGFKREFLQRDSFTTSKSGKCGTIHYTFQTGKVYQVREAWGMDGFYKLADDASHLKKVSELEVRERFAE